MKYVLNWCFFGCSFHCEKILTILPTLVTLITVHTRIIAHSYFLAQILITAHVANNSTPGRLNNSTPGSPKYEEKNTFLNFITE